MASFGKCCCQDNGCCCIDRVDVDFAVPTPGQPGASIGSWGWDVATTPTATEATQTIGGIPRLVQTCLYRAPSTTICIPPDYPSIAGYSLSYNTYFLAVERYIPADYFLEVDLDRYWWFQGNLLWRVYAYAQDLVLRVERRVAEGLMRVRLTGTYAMTRERYFSGRLRQYVKSTCTLLVDNTSTAPVDHIPCARALPDHPCTIGGGYFIPFTTNIERNTGYGIFMDTGWVSGNCDTIPTLSTAEPNIFGGYKSTSPPGDCRVPSGSNLVTHGSVPSPCSGLPTTFYSHVETYTPDNIWFATHPFSITPCGGPSEEEEAPP